MKILQTQVPGNSSIRLTQLLTRVIPERRTLQAFNLRILKKRPVLTTRRLLVLVSASCDQELYTSRSILPFSAEPSLSSMDSSSGVASTDLVSCVIPF